MHLSALPPMQGREQLTNITAVTRRVWRRNGGGAATEGDGERGKRKEGESKESGEMEKRGKRTGWGGGGEQERETNKL